MNFILKIFLKNEEKLQVKKVIEQICTKEILKSIIWTEGKLFQIKAQRYRK